MKWATLKEADRVMYKNMFTRAKEGSLAFYSLISFPDDKPGACPIIYHMSSSLAELQNTGLQQAPPLTGEGVKVNDKESVDSWREKIKEEDEESVFSLFRH